jgi:hypothetical protein
MTNGNQGEGTPNLWTRRRFMHASFAGAVVAQAAPHELGQNSPLSTERDTMIDVPFQQREPHIGLIGTGGRGTSLLGNLLAANAQVVAVCDVVKEKAEHAADLVVAAGQKHPDLYTENPHHYESLVARRDLDFVIVATPWRCPPSLPSKIAGASSEHQK